MKRMKIVFGQRRFQVLLTLAVLLLVVGGVVASGANFTATSANPGNVFTAGSLTIGNYTHDGVTNNEGALIENLTAAHMKPGDPAVTGTAVIKNLGTLPGTFTLTGSMTADANGLGSALHLVITEDSTQIYAGSLAGVLNNAALLNSGAWGAAGSGTDVHTFVFTVTFPSTGSDAGDNLLQGKTCTARFQWDAAQ